MKIFANEEFLMPFIKVVLFLFFPMRSKVIVALTIFQLILYKYVHINQENSIYNNVWVINELIF